MLIKIVYKDKLQNLIRYSYIKLVIETVLPVEPLKLNLYRKRTENTSVYELDIQ